MLYRYYIGSNNETGELESRKAIKIVSQWFQGFTAFNAIGYWQGKQENTLVIELESDNSEHVKAIARIICKDLQQQAVAVAEVGKMSFISL